MTFYVGELTDFLIKGWNATSTGALVGFCVAVAAVTILLEVIKLLRAYLRKLSQQNPLTMGQTADVINERSPLLRPLLIPPSIKDIRRRKFRFHLAQSGLHFLQVVIAYLLMLAVMSYNGYIFIAVVVASAISYFVIAGVRDEMLAGKAATLPVPYRDTGEQEEQEENETDGEGTHQIEVHRSLEDREPVYS